MDVRVKDGIEDIQMGYPDYYPRHYYRGPSVCENYRLRKGFNRFHVVTSVDRFCIYKQSSAELSEAINSMFRFYRDAESCYV